MSFIDDMEFTDKEMLVLMYRRGYEEERQESLKFLPMKKSMYHRYVKRLYNRIDHERRKQVIAGKIKEHRTDIIHKDFQEISGESTPNSIG